MLLSLYSPSGINSVRHCGTQMKYIISNRNVGKNFLSMSNRKEIKGKFRSYTDSSLKRDFVTL